MSPLASRRRFPAAAAGPAAAELGGILLLHVPCTSQFGFCHFTSCVKMKKDTGPRSTGPEIFGRTRTHVAGVRKWQYGGAVAVAGGGGVAEIYHYVCQLLRST